MQNPQNSNPVQVFKKPLYKHKGVIAIIVLVLVLCGLVFLYYRANKIEYVQLVAQTVPADWIPFSGEGWQIKYPPDYKYFGKKVSNSYLFESKNHESRLTVISKDLNMIPEKDLIKSFQDKYKFDIPEALLKMQVMGAEQFNHDDHYYEHRDVLLNRIIYINGLKGAQFAEKYIDKSPNFPSNSIMLKTSFEKNGRLVDLVMFVNPLDPNSPDMQIYSKFLSSFQFQ